MTNRNTILNELADLGSMLATHDPQNIYAVPAGYFEDLADQILNRIKALEANDAKEELSYLSPFLSNISKEMPYKVPAGFFQDLTEDVLKKISKYEDHQTCEEEIEALSPLLSSLKNKNPYSIPAGYFEKLETRVEKKETKVISITRRRWYRLAIAAAVIGIVAISGLAIFRPKPVDPNKNPQAWIEKNVDKKVSKDKIDEFVKLAEDGSTNVAYEKDDVKHAEIKELMKDVPEKEIEAFLNDAVALESNSDTDGLNE
jgi:gas vesicle protein